MSGSGSSGFGNGGGDSEIACNRLSFETQLSSPKPAVVSALNVGDVLSVVVESLGAVQVVVVKQGDQVAGGITSPKMARLLECLLQGSNYRATVVRKVGGQVTVRISPP